MKLSAGFAPPVMPGDAQMKHIAISIFLVLSSGCATFDEHRSLNTQSLEQIRQDLETIEVAAIVELLEAQVAGNFPIVDVGADVKKEVAIEKRVYTRGEIQLRGIVRQFLKGQCLSNILTGQSTSHINSFNIPTCHLVASRDNTVLEVPASNIPDLKIGEEYVILFDPSNPSDLYFTSIWPMRSEEASFVIDHLEKEKASNNGFHGTR